MSNIILGFVLGMAFAIIVGVITVVVDSRVHIDDIPDLDLTSCALSFASMLISIAVIIIISRR